MGSLADIFQKGLAWCPGKYFSPITMDPRMNREEWRKWIFLMQIWFWPFWFWKCGYLNILWWRKKTRLGRQKKGTEKSSSRKRRFDSMENPPFFIARDIVKLLFLHCHQWLFLVPLIGGRWYIITQLAIYKWYISGIYCQLGTYISPIPPITGTRNSCWLSCWNFFLVCHPFKVVKTWGLWL